MHPHQGCSVILGDPHILGSTTPLAGDLPLPDTEPDHAKPILGVWAVQSFELQLCIH